jgi:uncharacterized protein (DUF488 family)
MDAIGLCGTFGVGYEGQNLDVFISGLIARGTRTLIDIRLNPVSRKRGFSKRFLASSLAEAGITYWHFPELGNPKWNRAGFAGPEPELRRARGFYSCMIAGESAQARLGEIASAARTGGVAVMCFESDQEACHRYVVLQELQRRLDLAEVIVPQG